MPYSIINQSFKSYKKKYKNKFKKKEYIDINEKYIKFFVDRICQGDEISLPYEFGDFHIIGMKQKVKFNDEGKIKGLNPDWDKTKKLWKRDEEAKEKKQLVYCNNIHSNFIIYKYFWNKKTCKIKNKFLYSFKVSRFNKRKLSAIIKNGKEFKTKKKLC